MSRYDDRSNRKYSSHGSEQDFSRVMDRERNRERERERHRERHQDRNMKDERGRDKHEDNDHRQSRDNRRHREKDGDWARRNRHRSRSKDRSRNRSRSRSCSPSKSKRTSGFDMAPLGVSAVSGTAITGQLPDMPQPLTGLFPSMIPFAAQQFASLPLAMTQQATRHARRVYVGGLPPMANEQTIATFFSHVMSNIGGNASGPGDAVVNVYINHEKKFAFVEMRSVEEASNAMALDGIIFEGVAVRVRRPTDYNPSLAATLGPSQPSPYLNLSAVGLTPGCATGGTEGPDRIFVGGLPYYFTDAQIRELLESFGPLRGFDVVKDRDTGNSKGYGFCVYQDPSMTDIACAALNGLKMGDKTLTVRRATASTGQIKPEQELVLQQAQQHVALQKIALQAGGALSFPGVRLASPSPVTKVVCLTEVLSFDELRNDEEYEEILEDMREEGEKFGSLVNVVVPRPGQSGEAIIGVGKVFLEYADTIGSAKAKAALHGRRFGDNVVTATHYPEDRFLVGDYGAITEG